MHGPVYWGVKYILCPVYEAFPARLPSSVRLPQPYVTGPGVPGV